MCRTSILNTKVHDCVKYSNRDIYINNIFQFGQLVQTNIFDFHSIKISIKLMSSKKPLKSPHMNSDMTNRLLNKSHIFNDSFYVSNQISQIPQPLLPKQWDLQDQFKYLLNAYTTYQTMSSLLFGFGIIVTFDYIRSPTFDKYIMEDLFIGLISFGLTCLGVTMIIMSITNYYLNRYIADQRFKQATDYFRGTRNFRKIGRLSFYCGIFNFFCSMVIYFYQQLQSLPAQIIGCSILIIGLTILMYFLFLLSSPELFLNNIKYIPINPYYCIKIICIKYCQRKRKHNIINHKNQLYASASFEFDPENLDDNTPKRSVNSSAKTANDDTFNDSNQKYLFN